MLRYKKNSLEKNTYFLKRGGLLAALALLSDSFMNYDYCNDSLTKTQIIIVPDMKYVLCQRY